MNPHPAEPSRSAEEIRPHLPTGTLTMDLIADPAAASLVRDRLRSWLRQLGWPADDSDDIVLAVSEAVANVIDHAYRGLLPGSVWIVANLIPTRDSDRQAIQVIVRDRGRWRPMPDDPGHRGHGIPIMNGCMQFVHIRRHADGTAVIMISSQVRTGSGPASC
jgi:anti-sigma regulatory factor (Ser/Thr protein kinase)